MKKALLLVNPAAGKQAAKQHFFDIVSNLSLKYEVTVHITKSAEDLVDAARKCSLPTLIVCGGDGTLSGTVRGLWENPNRTSIKLGYIPCGTANDVASTLEIPKTMPAAALYVCRNAAKKHDIGLFGDRPFVYTASFGTFTKTSYATPQEAKNVLGSLAYLLTGATELFNVKGYDASFEYEGGMLEQKDVTFCGVSNSLSIGGGVIRYPDDLATLSDGKLELLVISRPKTVFDLENILRALATQDFHHDGVTLIRTPWVKITSRTPLNYTVDGENGGDHTEVTIRCLPEAINLIRK